uniref:hypothetical protein n=1 Tax=uncultured Sphingomonas sp. TaxID=158754 RepID=UPI0025DD4062|nr:hypothetical protein [uncultured Sphingomonas sp.]
MSTLQFYTERAAECRREADEATLANVRVRCLSAAEAWENMADRARRTQSYRTAHEAARPAAATDTNESSIPFLISKPDA